MILLTGCAGFIGWKTCSLLLEKGEEVVGIDNLNSYYDPKIKDWRLSELNKFPNFSFNRMDITEIEPLRQIFKDHNPEAVINLIEENLRKKAKIDFLPRHPADVMATCADIGKAERLAGVEAGSED